MCGIVCTYGRRDGVSRVLNALALLAYRAPDSTGLAAIAEDGSFAIRRCVGDSERLRARLAEEPLPPLRRAEPQIVMGHGRWAMVGAVTEANAHPLSDRSGDRLACENGSHNAMLMLNAYADQEAWWRARGVPADEAVHRTENTTEVLAYEWERMALLLAEGTPPPGAEPFMGQLESWGVTDLQERALRLAAWHLHQGNAHACAFFSRHQPETLYVTSHNKPVAVIARHVPDRESSDLIVASDVNAALTLWPPEEVTAAAHEIRRHERALHRDAADARRHRAAIQSVLETFAVDVIYLDSNLNDGRLLFVRIENAGQDGSVLPSVQVSRYDGTPLAVTPRRLLLNPAMVGKGGYASYTESHIAEIPDVVERIIATYIRDGQVQLDSVWHEEQLFAPGLNVPRLQGLFGPALARLRRILLVGEGSSWRDAHAAAPLFRQLLPGVDVSIHHPVELLNLGEDVDPALSLAVEISWSGTTDSVLKVDSWLSSMGVMRLGVTGRPQSDLGRRTEADAGTIDVQSGIEISVATVKGYVAVLTVLDLIALQIADIRGAESVAALPGFAVEAARLHDAIQLSVPQQLRSVIQDPRRREGIMGFATQCARYNKVAVVGNSPLDLEAELKIEELAQIVACSFGFEDASLKSLAERSALAADDERRILFILNLTNSEAVADALPCLSYLHEMGVTCLIHTYDHELAASWEKRPNTTLFLSPRLPPTLQPLVDAPFFFDLAVAMAYARGLTPAQIDRPRNLAKSVTVTGAERRKEVEARLEFRNVSLDAFATKREVGGLRDAASHGPPSAATGSVALLHAAAAALTDPLPEPLRQDGLRHLAIHADSEATENGARMAIAAWQALLGVAVTVHRRFDASMPGAGTTTAWVRLESGLPFQGIRDDQTIVLPNDMSALSRELLTGLYLIGLSVQVARRRGIDTARWESSLARLPLCIAEIHTNELLRAAVRAFCAPLVALGYDKAHLIGGGQDFAGVTSMARSLREQGFMAEPQYTDSAWHGPLAAVGGPDAAHDTLVIILATDPLFQPAALVDTQVYWTRQANILLVVPEGNQGLPAVTRVGARAILPVIPVPRPFTPLIAAGLGRVLAQEFNDLWEHRSKAV